MNEFENNWDCTCLTANSTKTLVMKILQIIKETRYKEKNKIQLYYLWLCLLDSNICLMNHSGASVHKQFLLDFPTYWDLEIFTPHQKQQSKWVLKLAVLPPFYIYRGQMCEESVKKLAWFQENEFRKWLLKILLYI